MPTFWVLGTSAPIIIPIGIVASSPSRRTHATVSHPVASAIRLSKSRKLGTRMTSIWGSSPRDWKSSCPVK